MGNKTEETTTYNQNLFNVLDSMCGFTALQSEMQEVLDAVEKDRKAQQTTNKEEWVSVEVGMKYYYLKWEIKRVKEVGERIGYGKMMEIGYVLWKENFMKNKNIPPVEYMNFLEKKLIEIKQETDRTIRRPRVFAYGELWNYLLNSVLNLEVGQSFCIKDISEASVSAYLSKIHKMEKFKNKKFSMYSSVNAVFRIK